MFNTEKFLQDLEFALGPIKDVTDFADAQQTLLKEARLKSPADIKNDFPTIAAIKGTDLPPAIRAYGDFMFRKSTQTLTGEDLARAQMITLSSIQRGAIDAAKVQAACRLPGDPMFQAITATGITPDCFTGGFFVSDGGYMTQQKGRKNTWYPSIRPEDTMARLVQIDPSAGVFIREMLDIVEPVRRIAAEEWSMAGTQVPQFLPKMRLNKRINGKINSALDGLTNPAAIEARLSPQSRRYLEVIYRTFKFFGMQDELKKQLLTSLPVPLIYQDMLFDLIRNPSQGYLMGCYFNGAFFSGAGIAKIPFTAAMLGRGDLPVLDAREIDVWFKNPKWMKGGKQVGIANDDKLKLAAIPIVADRLASLRVQMPSSLEPFRQYLTHHYVWDASEGSDTMHTDMIRALEYGKFGLFGFMRRR